MKKQYLIEELVEQWVQKALAGIKRKGTEGKFRAEARRKGYSDTMTYARNVMSGKVTGNKKRANFALNINKRKK